MEDWCESPYYCSIEIEDVAFAHIPKINCYVHNRSGCLLEETLWRLYDELTPELEGAGFMYECIAEDGYFHEEDIPF